MCRNDTNLSYQNQDQKEGVGGVGGGGGGRSCYLARWRMENVRVSV